MILYVVTTIVDGYPSKESEKYGGKRSPVICSVLERAVQIVEHNLGDIHETDYTYAVIETIEADVLYGGFSKGMKEWWYKWEGDRDTGKYVSCEKPEEYRKPVNIVRFGGIG